NSTLANRVSDSRPAVYQQPWLYLGVACLALLVAGLSDYQFWSPLSRPGETVSAEERLCQQFANLKNSGSPEAADLLAPPPVVPEEAVSVAEADRLDAELILHGDYRVRGVRPVKTAGSAGRFLLTLDGTCYSEPVRVQTPTGVDRRQRMASNPDLL